MRWSIDEFIEAARPCRRAPGDRWSADETYLKVAGQWAYLYRAIDQHGQVIDVLLSARCDLAAARRFSAQAMRAGTVPVEVTMGYYRVSLTRKQQAIRSAGLLATDAAGNPAPFASPTAYERASVAVPFGNCTEPANVKACRNKASRRGCAR